MKKNRYLIFAAALAVFLFCIGCGNVTQKVKSFVSIDAFNIHQVITKDSAIATIIMAGERIAPRISILNAF